MPFEQQPRIKKGAKGIPIEYWQYAKMVMEKDPGTGKMVPKMETDPETGKMKPVVRRLNPPLVRRYIVFNGDQIANIPPEHAVTIDEKDRSEAMEAMIANSEAEVKFDQKDCNFYRPSEDCVHVMPRENFKTLGDFYGTVAHEIAHSTGAESRMNREGITHSDGFGGPVYAREELRAEMASMFLAQDYGVAPGRKHYESHVAYLQSWAEVIEKDPDELFRAAAEAQKMTDYIREHMIEKNLEKERPKVQEQEAPSKADECLQKLSVTLNFVEGPAGDIVLGGGARSFSVYTPAGMLAGQMKPEEEAKELGGHSYQCGRAYRGEELNRLMNDFIKDDATASLPGGLYSKASVTIRYELGDGREISSSDRWDIGDGDTFLLKNEKSNGYTALANYLNQTGLGRAIGVSEEELEEKTASFEKPGFSKNTELYKDLLKSSLLIASDAGERMDKLDLEHCDKNCMEKIKQHQYADALKDTGMMNIQELPENIRPALKAAVQMKCLQSLGYDCTPEQMKKMEDALQYHRQNPRENRWYERVQQNLSCLIKNTEEQTKQHQQMQTKKRDFKPIHRSITIPDKKPKRRRVVSRRSTNKSQGISR